MENYYCQSLKLTSLMTTHIICRNGVVPNVRCFVMAEGFCGYSGRQLYVSRQVKTASSTRFRSSLTKLHVVANQNCSHDCLYRRPLSIVDDRRHSWGAGPSERLSAETDRLPDLHFTIAASVFATCGGTWRALSAFSGVRHRSGKCFRTILAGVAFRYYCASDGQIPSSQIPLACAVCVTQYILGESDIRPCSDLLRL